MTIFSVIQSAEKTGKAFRRKGWSHADHLKLVGTPTAYGNGELRWTTGERAQLFYVNDLTATDWHLQGEVAL